MNGKKKLIVFILILVLSFASICLYNKVFIDKVKPSSYVSFQDRHSMDWSGEEENMLMLLAENKGGTIEDRAYNIVVALNRVWDKNYPNTIEEVVDLELPCGKMKLIISDETKEAMRMVIYDRFDNTQGSFEYRDIYLEEEF